VIKFKILILQRYYGLGDTQPEYQIIDRTSFKKFLDVENGDKVSLEEKTVWTFRESLTSKEIADNYSLDLVTILNAKILL
jgi:transposase, IS5 family